MATDMDMDSKDFDFIVIFIHPTPSQIQNQAHELITKAVESDECFRNVDDGEELLKCVSSKILELASDDDGPRIEYFFKINGRKKHTGCMFILEHLMLNLRKYEDKPTSLRYKLSISAPNPTQTHLAPFKRHFSAMDSFNLEEFSFANLLKHDQLYVRQRVCPTQSRRMDQQLERRFADERLSNSKLPPNRISLDSGIGTSPPRTDSVEANQPMPKTEAIDGLNKIAVEFEHDLKQIGITFLIEQFNYQKDRRSSTVDQVRLNVRYAAITQVHLELDKRGKDQFWMRLSLRLKYPPEVWQVRDVFGLEEFAKRGARKDKRREKGFRVLNWGGGNRKRMTTAISDSPLLVLNFEEAGPAKLSALLGRFMGILKMDMQMRNIEESDVPAFEDAIFTWLEALDSRGFVVRDHFLDPEESRAFFDSVRENTIKFPPRALKALEMLADKLADRSEVRHERGLTGMFEGMVEELARNGLDREERLNDGYERVRRVVITPSRMLLHGHETLMGNRALRLDRERYPPEKFIRVLFRDENGQSVRPSNIGSGLIDEFIYKKLTLGISIMGEEYHCLGTSNSQMRDGGCYFLNATLDEVKQFRKRLGQFDELPTLPKMISRLGLCFTQGKDIKGLDLGRQVFGYDIVGGRDSNGKPYTFSDGCGCLSVRAAEIIAEEFGFDKQNMPSCYQFRYAGYKGVLSVNPELDNEGVDFYFRPSQKKFNISAEEERECRLEIVKHSAPSPLFLNRPFINVLDQMTLLHSPESHLRVCNRVHTLLDEHIFSVCSTLSDEFSARKRLGELPRLVEYGLLQTVEFTREPFFRLVLRAAAKVSILRLRHKLAVAIPASLGRMLFGVMDETGTLQYGQVFVQYSEDMFQLGRKIILEGPVMITKSPTVVLGDVRMFKAVDVPALHHLVDVVVFPQFGPRPHPDEMAGSDLDGDEYAVIWDRQMALDKNEPAADYSPEKEAENAKNIESANNSENAIVFQRRMARYFVDYLKKDSIGPISNAHLFNSDLYGIENPTCAEIARKHHKAVDFPKTGKAPDPLKFKWTDENPPERYGRAPDYMEKDAINPHYVSSRLNGQLFRRVKELSNFVTKNINEEEDKLPDVDKTLQLREEEHSDFYLEQAQKHYNHYAAQIKQLMTTYGIVSEGELFSSSYTTLRNRISDREADDMSFFNTTRLIEERLSAIVDSARHIFFATFGASKEELTDEYGVCADPPDVLVLLARAYYTVAYDSLTRCFLSFPWVACWDVLDHIRRTCMLQRGLEVFSFDPLGDELSRHIIAYCSQNREQFRVDVLTQNGDDPGEVLVRKELLHRYTLRHRGLEKLMFFCVGWAEKQRVFELTPLKAEHICLLLISFGLKKRDDGKMPWLAETPPSWHPTPEHPRLRSHRLGRHFCSFLEGLASRDFQRMATLQFDHLGLLQAGQDFFANGEWRPLHPIALDTYQHLLFADNFGELLPNREETTTEMSLAPSNNDETKSEEGPVFIVELPGRVTSERFINNQVLLQRICHATGCERVAMRRDPMHPANWLWTKPLRVIVSSWGCPEALERLRQLFAVQPPVDLTVNRRLRIQNIPNELVVSLDGLLNGARRRRADEVELMNLAELMDVDEEPEVQEDASEEHDDNNEEVYHNGED